MKNEWKKGLLVTFIAWGVFALTYCTIMAIAKADGLIASQDETQICVLIFSSVMAVVSAAILLPLIDFPEKRNLIKKGEV